MRQITRLIFGNDNGVWTGVDRGDGTISAGIGSAPSVRDSRNGTFGVLALLYVLEGPRPEETSATDDPARPGQDSGSGEGPRPTKTSSPSTLTETPSAVPASAFAGSQILSETEIEELEALLNTKSVRGEAK